MPVRPRDPSGYRSRLYPDSNARQTEKRGSVNVDRVFIAGAANDLVCWGKVSPICYYAS
jgi:hypothetical protein